MQVSYDVANLYPSVPLNEVMKCRYRMMWLKQHTKLTISEIKMLIDLCLSKCYFLWNEEIFELKDSGPIGLSLTVVIAEAFLQVLGKKQ